MPCRFALCLMVLSASLLESTGSRCARGSTVTLDFESYRRDDTDLHEWGSVVSIDGFTLTAMHPVPGNSTKLQSLGTLRRDFAGRTALYHGGSTGVITLTRADMGKFSFRGIDLAELPSFTFSGDPIRPPAGTFAVDFIGFHSDGSTVETTLNVQVFADVPLLQSLAVTGFENVVSVHWSQGPGGHYEGSGIWNGSPTHQFDRVVLELANPPTVSTPEPNTACLSVVATIVVAGFALVHSRGRNREVEGD